MRNLLTKLIIIPAATVKRMVRWLVCKMLKIHKWEYRGGCEARKCLRCDLEQYESKGRDEHGNPTGWLKC